MMDTAEFIAHGCRANPWVLQPGFHVSTLTHDWLHVMDLTLIPDAAASALLELTAHPSDLLPGPDQDARLATAYRQFISLCRSHGIRNLDVNLRASQPQAKNPHNFK